MSRCPLPRPGTETPHQYPSTHYLGFTFAGLCEPLAIALLVALVLMDAPGTPSFRLAMAALLVFVAMHAVYWAVTHPVNGFWLSDTRLSAAASGFFAFGRRGGEPDTRPDWTRLRDRWEYSHVARAALGLVGLAMLAISVAM